MLVALLCLAFLGFASADFWGAAGPAFQNVWLWWTGGGLILGAAYWHPYRGTGFVPYAATGAAVACIWGAVGGMCEGTVAVAAACLGVVIARVIAFVLRFGVSAPRMLVCVVLCFVVPFLGGALPFPGAVAAQVSVFAVFSWYWFFRPCFELACEPPIWWMYKVRAAGPGLHEMPPVGPCLVIANHGSWFDPLFLAKVLPRRVTPMMTARFYDKPVIGWLVRRFGVIRVPEHAMKQDTPELREAVAALDRGECVVIFPEGFLRRNEEKPLKRFGRGVWRILNERPNTPVFSVWIEGAWGSYCSYWNGPPTKNKKRDRRRPIGVAVNAPVVVPADVLANHLRTRVFLMNEVLAARIHLGLDALPAVELPAKDEDRD